MPLARRAVVRLTLALAAASVLGACTEKLDTGAACPALCPDQDVAIRDTIIDAVALDTTLENFPAKGSESFLLVASRGAELDTRAVVRFDSLVRTFDRSTTDTGVAITSLTTARVKVTVDTANSIFTAPVTVNVYDADTPVVDPSDADVLARFGSAQLLGSATFATRADVKDSLVVPLDVGKVAALLAGGQRIRLGFQVTSSAPVELRVQGTVSSAPGTSPLLSYDPTDSTDGIKPILIATRSSVPAASSTLAFNARDYTIAVSGQQALAGDVLAVGGIPARRVYMSFSIPSALLDSATIVRATLLLTQRPSASANPDAAVSVVPLLGLGGKDVPEPGRAALLVASEGVGGMTGLSIAPKDAGVRQIEMGTVVRSWTTAIFGDNPRVIVLQVGSEGYAPGEVRFYSQEAADASLRPRLRLNYVPRFTFGVP